MKKLLSLSMAVTLLATATSASASGLNIGDPAPPLQVTEWVKGSAVDLSQAKGNQIVVVEFWATWCGPCIDSIPHLTGLQREFGSQGVTIVGLTAHDDGNTQEMVQKFTTKQGDKIGYRIAYEKDRATYESYMTAANEMGIPTAFVVDKSGRIAWIGHPQGDLHQALGQMVAGTYDIELAAKDRPLRQKTNEAWMNEDWDQVIKLADERIKLQPQRSAPYMTKFDVYDTELKEPTQALAAAKKIISIAKDDPDDLAKIARKLARKDDTNGFNKLAFETINRAVQLDPKDGQVLISQFDVLSAMQRDDEALAVAVKTVTLLKDDPKELGSFARTLAAPDAKTRCHDLAMQAVELAIAAEPDQPRHLQTKFNILVTCKQDTRNANIVGRYLVEQTSDDAGTLNNFAWDLLTKDDYKGKFNELALVAAERCDKASGGENWMYLDTYALAQFDNGNYDEAIKLETKALEVCDKDHPMRKDLEEALKRFENGKKK